jgi:tetratricopeptide (TPR) repeat protein
VPDSRRRTDVDWSPDSGGGLRKVRPAWGIAHPCRGIALLAAGDTDGAVAACRQSVALDPDTAVFHSNLGDALKRDGQIEEAIASFIKSTEVLTKAIKLGPKNGRILVQRGDSYKEAGRYDEALADYQEALRTGPDFADPLEPGVPPRLVKVCRHVARSLEKAGRVQEAMELCHRVAQECRSAVGREKKTFNAHNRSRGYWDLAVALESLAHVTDAFGDAEETENLYRDAHAIWRQLVDADTHAMPGPREGMGHSYRFLATNAWKAGNTKQAVDFFTEAVDVFGKLWADYPDRPANAHFLADSSRLRGQLLAIDKQFGDAEKAYRLSIEIHQQWMAQFPDQPINQFEVAASYSDLAALLVATGQNEADDVRRRFLEVSDKWLADYTHVVGAVPQDPRPLWNLAGCLESYAQRLNELGETLRAEKRYREANAIWRELVADFDSEDYRFHLGINYDLLGSFLWQHARPDEAIESRRAARAIWEKLVAEFNHEDRWTHLAFTNEALGDLADAVGRVDEAAAAYREAADVWEKLAADFPSNAGYGGRYSHLLVVLTNVYAKQAHGLETIGRAEEARAAFAKAFALAPDDLMIRIQALPPVSRADAYAQALADLRAFWIEHPRQPSAAVLALAQVQQRWGDQQAHAGHWSVAAEALVAAAASYENLLAQIVEHAESTTNVGVPATAKDIAWYRHELGYVLTYAGEALRKLGRLPEANTALARGLEIHESLANDAEAPMDTKSRLVWNQIELGMVFQTRGLPREAEQKYREAIVLLEGPRKADYYLSAGYEALAQLCELEGRSTEAIEAQRKAVAAWQQFASETKQSYHRYRQAWANERLAAMLLRANESAAAVSAYGEAVAILESFIQEQPDRADHYFNCGLLRSAFASDLSTAGDHNSAQKEFHEAIAAYTKVIELAPDNAVAYNNLAWLYATCPETELRDPAKAVALAKKAVELKPAEGTGWNTLGAAQYRAGEWQAAVESLTRSLELRSGGDAFDWYFLTMAHCRLGNMDDARKWHPQAVEWVERNGPLLASNRQVADELRRFRAEAEEVLGKEE